MALSSEDEVSQTTDLAYFQGQYDDYMLQLKYDEVYATLLTSRYSLSLTYLLTHLTTNSLTHSLTHSYIPYNQETLVVLSSYKFFDENKDINGLYCEINKILFPAQRNASFVFCNITYNEVVETSLVSETNTRYLLTHLLTHSPTHSLTYSFTHSLTHLLTHSPTH
jgi:hypothetical protein